MKKSLIIAALLMSVVLLGSCSKSSANTVTIVNEMSYLSDFTISDGNVYESCTITLFIDSDKSQKVELIADVSDDVKNNLFEERYITCKNSDTNENFFIIEAKQKKTFNVTISGKNGSGTQKSDRNLPEITVKYL